MRAIFFTLIVSLTLVFVQNSSAQKTVEIKGNKAPSLNKLKKLFGKPVSSDANFGCSDPNETEDVCSCKSKGYICFNELRTNIIVKLDASGYAKTIQFLAGPHAERQIATKLIFGEVTDKTLKNFHALRGKPYVIAGNNYGAMKYEDDRLSIIYVFGPVTNSGLTQIIITWKK